MPSFGESGSVRGRPEWPSLLRKPEQALYGAFGVKH